MNIDQKCCKCNRYKNMWLCCKSCADYSCITCLCKTYLNDKTPVYKYYSCFKCSKLFSPNELPKKCIRTITKKLNIIYDSMQELKPVLKADHPYAYINQLYIANVPYNHEHMLRITEKMHESFINGEDYEMPQVLPKLPVLHRGLKPNAPPELIKIESLRCPVLTGLVEELYESYSHNSLYEAVFTDYDNRIFNEQIDCCINDYEAGKITKEGLSKLLAHLEYNKKYYDPVNHADSKNKQAAESDNEATEAVY